MRCENFSCYDPVVAVFRRAKRQVKAGKKRAVCKKHLDVIEKAAKAHGERLIIERIA